MAMARSTPAQKPRGLARRMSMGGPGGGRDTVGAHPVRDAPGRLYQEASRTGCAPTTEGGLSHALTLAGPQAEHDQHYRADTDAAVGQVEHGVAPLPPVDLDEVGDGGGMQSVDQVADRAADDQRQRRRRTPVAPRGARQPHRQHGTDHQRQYHEEPALPASAMG